MADVLRIHDSWRELTALPPHWLLQELQQLCSYLENIVLTLDFLDSVCSSCGRQCDSSVIL